ncbi:MAG: hypothetical protein V1656_01365 [Candidatus Jorgensenbacteria bacterium]
MTQQQNKTNKKDAIGEILNFLLKVGFLVIAIVGIVRGIEKLDFSSKKKEQCVIQRIPIVLKGEGILSAGVPVEKGYRAYFSGPPSAMVHFPDGDSCSIARRAGMRWSPFRFSGPKGDTVLVDLVPLMMR